MRGIALIYNVTGRTALKIIDLIENLPKNPFTGKGKPEALRFNLAGFWSRRLTQ